MKLNPRRSGDFFVCILLTQRFYNGILHAMKQSKSTISSRQTHFIETAKKVHDDFYSYDKVLYLGSKKPVIIVCPEHGDFMQLPNNHLSKHGCSKCKEQKSRKALAYTQTEFIAKARQVHADAYGYDDVVYRGSYDSIDITCKTHGNFSQVAINHLQGNGCQKCAGKFRYNSASFAETANEKHGGRYTYDNVLYKNNHTHILITCRTHGDFAQTPNMHLMGNGCPHCNRADSIRDTPTFISAAMLKYGDKYGYENAVYANARTKISIVCKEHGEFQQIPKDHISGHDGCPRCSAHASQGEDDVADIVANYAPIIKRTRDVIDGYELDIYVPSRNMAVEYCGLKWHSEEKRPNNYHVTKQKLCEKRGIQLLTIFENEWLYKRELVVRTLRAKFEGNKAAKGARHYTVVPVSTSDQKTFHTTNHLQGYGKATVAYGLKDSAGTLSAVVSLLQRKSGVWEITRYATAEPIAGGFSKLLKYFKNNVRWHEVYTFADLRWSNGDLYKKTGFTQVDRLRPDYGYVVSGKIAHKFGYRRAFLPKKLGETYDPALSEHQNMLNHKIYRIYDCGKLKFAIYRSTVK